MRREWIERREYVDVAKTADAANVRKGERRSRVLEAPLTPTAIALPIMLMGANLVLANEQHAAVVLMLLVVGELCEAKFWLEPKVELAYNHNLRRKQLREIKALIDEHYEEIVDAWRDHFDN